MKRLGICMLLLAAICVAGCSKDDSAAAGGTRVPVSLFVKGVDGVVAAPAGMKSVSLYVCDKGEVVWLNRLNISLSSQIDVPVSLLGKGVLYCIINEAVCLGAKDLVLGSSEAAIKALASSCDAGAGTDGTIAMCGSADLTGLNHGSSIEMNLKRNMARFDLVIQHADITPKSISVKGLPQHGSLFADQVLASTETYDLTSAITYTANSGAAAGVFYAHEFESTAGFKPHVEITSLYGEVELKSYIDISKAERNKVYKIYLREVGGELVGDIVLEGDMEVGDDSVVNPDESGSSIFINPTLSTLSEGVVLGSDNRRLTFPAKGGEALIAFSGEAIEYLDQIGTSPNVTLEKQSDGRYKITVAANRTINPAHEAVVLKFKAAAELDPEKFVRISVVMISYAPFEVVTMGGIYWMAVNAQGNHIANYPILKGGATVRSLFAGDWNRWSGTGEQWGPRPGDASGAIRRFAAWFNAQWSGVDYRTLPTINGAIIGGDKLTQWDNHAYCPAGWRLPKRSEFAAIWPPEGTVIDDETSPVAYTTPIGNFTAKLEKIGNNCIVISDGVSELIFPLAGFREHNGVHNPGNSYDQHGRDVGSTVYYWCYDRPAGGDARVFGYEKNTIQNGGTPRYTIVDRAFNAATWLNSRCVREAKL